MFSTILFKPHRFFDESSRVIFWNNLRLARDHESSSFHERTSNETPKGFQGQCLCCPLLKCSNPSHFTVYLTAVTHYLMLHADQTITKTSHVRKTTIKPLTVIQKNCLVERIWWTQTKFRHLPQRLIKGSLKWSLALIVHQCSVLLKTCEILLRVEWTEIEVFGWKKSIKIEPFFLSAYVESVVRLFYMLLP